MATTEEVASLPSIANIDSPKFMELKETELPISLNEEKELWTTAKTIEETVKDLYNAIDEDGFRRYLKYAKWYVHRLSLYHPPPSFDIHRNDLSTRVKKELAYYSKDKELLKEILIEVIRRICDIANTSDFNKTIETQKIKPRFI